MKRAAYFDVIRWPGTPRRWVWIVTRGKGGRVLATSYPHSWAREDRALQAMHEIIDAAVQYAKDEVPF